MSMLKILAWLWLTVHGDCPSSFHVEVLHTPTCAVQPRPIADPFPAGIGDSCHPAHDDGLKGANTKGVTMRTGKKLALADPIGASRE
jgi:hypothetical protein